MITCFIILHYTFSLWSKIHEETYVLLKQIMYNGMIQFSNLRLVCSSPTQGDRFGIGIFFSSWGGSRLDFSLPTNVLYIYSNTSMMPKKARGILKLSIKIFSNSFKAFFITILWNIMIYNETWNMVKIYINNLFKKIKSLGLLYMYLFLKL